MPGFIANCFEALQGPLFDFIQKLDAKSSFPHLILCYSAIEIQYLKKEIFERFPNLTNLHFHTLDSLLSELINKQPNVNHVITPLELNFLQKNHGYKFNTDDFAHYFLQFKIKTIPQDYLSAILELREQLRNLGWQTPVDFLHNLTKSGEQFYGNCILFGLSTSDPLLISFLEVLKIITRNVIFFSFDYGDSGLTLFERLESFFGPADTIFISHDLHSEKYFYRVEGNCFDFVVSQITRTRNEKIAYICPNDAIAKIVSAKLRQLKISHHNNFQDHLSSSTDNLFDAWCAWQKYPTPEFFSDFCHFLQIFQLKLFPGNFDIDQTLSTCIEQTFSRDFTVFAEKDPTFSAILERYPLLPEQGLWGNFLQRTTPIFLQIKDLTKHFPSDLMTTKEAFLSLIREIYEEQKPEIPESNFSNIYLTDLLSATQLTLDQIFIFCEKDSEIIHSPLINFLSAKKISFIGNACDFSQEAAELCLASQIRQNFTSFFVKSGQKISPHHIQIVHCQKPQQPLYEIFPELGEAQKEHPNPEATEHQFSYQTNSPVQLSATAIERAYIQPEEVWYRQILNINPNNFLLEEKKWSGIFTHRYLQWPHTRLPDFETFQSAILEKHSFFKKQFSTTTPSFVQKILDPQKALFIAEKLCSIERFPFLCSEVPLAATVYLSDGTALPLFGRADCILSQQPFQESFSSHNASNDLLLIDFKTGHTSQSDLKNLTKKFTRMPTDLSGLQLVLYGLILRSLNYRNIQLLILDADPYADPEPVPLDCITTGENMSFIERYLKSLLINGYFGYTERNPYLSDNFTYPTAEVPPPNDIIREQKQKILWK